MIDKINISQPLIKSGPSPKQPDSAKAPTNNGADASPCFRGDELAPAEAGVDYASLISQAAQAAKTDTKAIQQAQELLQSGQLESQERIREAAEYLLTFGI